MYWADIHLILDREQRIGLGSLDKTTRVGDVSVATESWLGRISIPLLSINGATVLRWWQISSGAEIKVHPSGWCEHVTYHEKMHVFGVEKEALPDAAPDRPRE